MAGGWTIGESFFGCWQELRVFSFHTYSVLAFGPAQSQF